MCRRALWEVVPANPLLVGRVRPQLAPPVLAHLQSRALPRPAVKSSAPSALSGGDRHKALRADS